MNVRFWGHVDFAREDVDVAVRHADGDWLGLAAVRLSSEELFPVCSPKLMSGPRAIREPTDLLRHPLLHMEDQQNWARWLEAAGVATPMPCTPPCSIAPAC